MWGISIVPSHFRSIYTSVSWVKILVWKTELILLILQFIYINIFLFKVCWYIDLKWGWQDANPPHHLWMTTKVTTSQNWGKKKITACMWSWATNHKGCKCFSAQMFPSLFYLKLTKKIYSNLNHVSPLSTGFKKIRSWLSKAQRDIKLNPLLEHEKNSKFLVKFLGYNNL